MEHFEQQLQSLWQEGGRDIALSFLRRAVSVDMPLGNLVAALHFPDVTRHLGTITLRDVLLSEAPAEGGPRSGAPSAQRATASEPTRRRKRRSAEEMAQMQEALVAMLRDEPGSLNTTQMVSALGEQGFDIDSMRVNAMLRGLGSEGMVSDLGGKPKSWRASAKLRNQSR